MAGTTDANQKKKTDNCEERNRELPLRSTIDLGLVESGEWRMALARQGVQRT